MATERGAKEGEELKGYLPSSPPLRRGEHIWSRSSAGRSHLVARKSLIKKSRLRFTVRPSFFLYLPSLLPQVFYCFGCQKGWKGEREGEIGAALSEWGLGKHEIDRNETKERKRRTDDGRRI